MKQGEPPYGVAVHGGAGAWPADRGQTGRERLRPVLVQGKKLLEQSQPAVMVAVACVAMMEDDPLYNAGTGSCLTIEGHVEMDACVMDGSRWEAGAVAAIREVQNPIQVAHRVLDRTEDVLLAGEGAERFARAMGFERYDPVTEEAQSRYQTRLESFQAGKDKEEDLRHRELLHEHPQLRGETVGAVVLDGQGNLAAATSTGGRILKLAGRVGDTPIPGAGTYATPNAASSATGKGELIMRLLTTQKFCESVKRGRSPASAARSVLREMEQSVGREVGLIGMGQSGEVGVSHGTDSMPHGWVTAGMEEPHVSLRTETG